MKIDFGEKLPKTMIAQRVLDQLEPLHADDPAENKDLKEANKIAVKAAKEALEKWVAGSE